MICHLHYHLLSKLLFLPNRRSCTCEGCFGFPSCYTPDPVPYRKFQSIGVLVCTTNCAYKAISGIKA